MRDRRRSTRRPLNLEARLTALSDNAKVDIAGELVEMSGCGALMSAPGLNGVPPGEHVQIRADWPAVREDRRGAVLIILGTVVRYQPPGCVAIEIGRCYIQPLGVKIASFTGSPAPQT
ncbi:MAG TPA: hypothetical protein VFA28_09905 [Bryobacteraceae bacterium]|jgi:hypothetical protein|nr:hypothetical protein [Bryobacteraceae bacterium]